MALDLSGLANLANQLNRINSLVLVTPFTNTGYRAQQNTGLLDNPFLFDIEAENTVALQSDITDYVSESQGMIQDGIINRPEIITVRGFVGELNNVTPQNLNPLRQATEKLTVLTAFEPVLSLAAQRAYNDAFQAYQAAQNSRIKAEQISALLSSNFKPAVSINGVSVNQAGQTRQQSAFYRLYGYRDKKTLFTVQTPWAIFQNMAMENLEFIQPDDNEQITDIQISFKKMNFSSVLYANQKFSGRAGTQTATNQINAATKGTPVDSRLRQFNVG